LHSITLYKIDNALSIKIIHFFNLPTKW